MRLILSPAILLLLSSACTKQPELAEPQYPHLTWSQIGNLPVPLEIESLDLGGKGVTNRFATELPRFQKVTVLNLRLNPLSNIEPLAQMPNLRDIDISHTAVNDLRPLRRLSRLETFAMENVPASNLDFLPLSVTLLILKRGQIPSPQIRRFHIYHPNCRIIQWE